MNRTAIQHYLPYAYPLIQLLYLLALSCMQILGKPTRSHDLHDVQMPFQFPIFNILEIVVLIILILHLLFRKCPLMHV